jgi:hypothetical protein
MDIVRTEQEVDELLNQCAEYTEQGETKYPGLTYEQGVTAALEWVCGYTDEVPME